MGEIRLALQGSKLSPDEAAALEGALRSAPDDLVARTKLLGYYSTRRSEEDRARRRAHLLWLIAQAPAAPVTGSPFGRLRPSQDPEGHEQAEAVWRAALAARPDDPALLANAAGFFTQSDRSLARELLHRAQEVEPANPAWSLRLAHLSELGAAEVGHGEGAALVRRSLAELERARPARDDAEATSVWLVQAARTASAAGEPRRAREWASELLAQAEAIQGTWNHGNAVHHGHLVLGRLALAAGEVASAKEHLLAAGQTPGSPQLNSFGPNVVLAEELLDLEEREAVLAFLAACRRFWPTPQLERWEVAVRAGGAPEFGANRRY